MRYTPFLDEKKITLRYAAEDTQKFLLAEMQRWGKVVADHGIKVD